MLLRAEKVELRRGRERAGAEVAAREILVRYEVVGVIRDGYKKRIVIPEVGEPQRQLEQSQQNERESDGEPKKYSSLPWRKRGASASHAVLRTQNPLPPPPPLPPPLEPPPPDPEELGLEAMLLDAAVDMLLMLWEKFEALKWP